MEWMVFMAMMDFHNDLCLFSLFLPLTDAPRQRPLRILVIGHSILFWAKKRAERKGAGSCLGLGPTVMVFWRVARGMCWSQLLPTVLRFLLDNPPPDIVLVHLGENDLARRKSYSLRVQIKQDLSLVMQWCPGVKIVWSSFLPRRVWRYARSIRKVDLARKRVNAYVVSFILKTGGGS